MFDFIGNWFKSKEKKEYDRKKFTEAVHLMLDGEATPEQKKLVMDKISCCQFSNSKFELEKCLRDKLKSLNCCQEMPKNLDQTILEKLNSQQA
jgi:hypothetical protein